MGSEWDLYFGIGSIACGLYCFYALFNMKTKGKICAVLLLDKETAKKQCKDVGAYLVEVMPPVTVLGTGITAYGIITLLYIYNEQLYLPMMIMLVVTLAILVWFGMVTTKARKKYFD